MKLSFTKVRRKLLRWIAFFAFLIFAGGLAYYKLMYQPGQAADEPTLQTATVRQGDLVISATGTGTLTAPEEELGFTADGQATVAGVFVKTGDLVQEGELLAQVDSRQAEIDYAEAKRQYRELTSAAAIASAQQAIADAQADLDSGRLKLEYLISPEVFYWETEIEKGERGLKKAKARVDESPSDKEAQQTLADAEAFLDFAQDKLADARQTYENEYVPNTFPIALDRDKDVHAAPTDLEILQARLAIGEAQTRLKESRELYNVLTGDPIPENTSNASLIELQQAQRDLQESQATLDGTHILAPFSGKVMEVNVAGGDTVEANANGGDTVESDSIIILADTSRPYLEVFWDESDWDKAVVGNDVEVTFDNLPDQLFTGKVTEVDSELYTSFNSTVIRGEVTLDSTFAEVNLPIGASASVEVISQRAENAVLIPVEALHETSPGEYAVFVVEDGRLRLRVIKVGLQDQLYAEVKSGLQPGDVVSTGITETE